MSVRATWASWEEARQGSVIFNQLDTFEMTAPTMFLPFEVDIPRCNLWVRTSTTTSPWFIRCRRFHLEARAWSMPKKFVIHQVWSGEMEEDSIIPSCRICAPKPRSRLSSHSDYVVLNGDTVTAATGKSSTASMPPRVGMTLPRLRRHSQGCAGWHRA